MGDGIVIWVAVVIADDEQPAGIQIEAVDMPVGPNQVGSDGAGRAQRRESTAPRASAAVKSAPVSVAAIEVRIGEVLAGEVAAGKIVAIQVDAAQIVGLVAGRGVELASVIPVLRQCTGTDFRQTTVEVRHRSPLAGSLRVKSSGQVEPR